MAKKDEEMIPFPGEMGINEFKGKPIRKVFEQGEWFFSISDVVGAIVETDRPSKYWSDLKRKLIKEGSGQLSDIFGQLKMTGPDGKEYPTDAANAETMFRIIQSIGSPRAEPFKRWLAKVAFERIQEFQNPELAIQRAILDYQSQGHSDDWIKARIRTVLSRKELTSEWASRGVIEGREYAILTNVISQETFDIAIVID